MSKLIRLMIEPLPPKRSELMDEKMIINSKSSLNLGKHYGDEVKKKLHFKDLKIPRLTAEEIEHNIEMIASEDEDYITLFQEGFITNQELAELLSGERRLD